MTTIRCLLLTLFCAVLPLTAFAADCAKPGSPDAKAVRFTLDAQDMRTGLAFSIHLGLSPSSFPADRIAAMTRPCKIKEFQAGRAFTLYGAPVAQGPESEPSRFAISGNDLTRIAYLGLMPFPKPALDAMHTGPKDGFYSFKKPEFMYALAVTDGTKRQIFRFYDAIPDDESLALDMCAALLGEDPVIARYDSIMGAVEFAAPAPPEARGRPRCRTAIS
jgi:hypothetical protein